MEKLSSRVNCFSRRWKGQLQPSTPLLGSHASRNTRPTQSESSQRLWAMHWLYGRPSVDRAHIGEGGNLPAIDANVELCPFRCFMGTTAWSSGSARMRFRGECLGEYRSTFLDHIHKKTTRDLPTKPATAASAAAASVYSSGARRQAAAGAAAL